MTPPPLRVALSAAAAGGMIGSLLRAGITEWFPVGSGFPWTVFAINVVGSAVLAAVPAATAIRRTPWVGVFLGTGVLGGFTTMSAASTETVSLFERHQPGLALTYVLGTLAAALIAVLLVDRLSTPAERAAADEGEVNV